MTVHRSFDVHFELGGVRFVWNAQKAADNLDKHHVRFEVACEVFLDPLSRLVDAGVEDEARDALLGESRDGRLFFVVHVVRAGDVTRIISARRASRAEQLEYEEHV